MPKIQTIYVCSKCDAQFPKWQGRCPECGGWGTLVATKEQKNKKTKEIVEIGEVIDLDKIVGKDFKRIETGILEFDRVLGGGIVPGSLVLLGGDPGIGKSTLVLQVADKITRMFHELETNKNTNKNLNVNSNVLYVSGEESAEQIKLRMTRLAIKPENLKFLGETNIETICATIQKLKPKLAIIDSIQTMASEEIPSEAGSVNQVRASTVRLLEVAKKENISIFLIGHVTKEGQVAGPKTLEHLVDTVLYLEGDRYHSYRILRVVKNRFGSTGEVGVFEMRDKGLKEVKNPSEIFLGQRKEILPGSVITCVMEGTRPLLVEIQALTSRTYFGYPQRRAAGFDFNRLGLLIAVLSKRTGLSLGNQDIHLNVVGGLKIQEPAADLAASLAIASSFKSKIVSPSMVAFGEVGLGGEIRPISQTEKRITEAEKLGFKKVLFPEGKYRLPSVKCEIVKIKTLNEAIKVALE